jgi:hypothetical protein
VGSFVEASTYVGTGTFYASGYRNPYTSLALYVKPSYDLGTKYHLALRGRVYLEEEIITLPDTTNGRRFYPLDPWVWLAADNLHTFERSKIRIGGLVRAILPLSYESRYEHMLFGIAPGFTVNRDFEFGQVNDEARKWSLKLTWSLVVPKYFQTSHFRGSGPNDTTGCLAASSLATGGISAGGGPSVSDADRCGGPANTNFAVGNGFLASLSRGKWSLGASLLIANNFKYAFPTDALAPTAGVPAGRSDTSWGILSVGYQLRPHLGLGAGVASLQPALDSRYRYPRFPFFDLSGTNANNYTQLFLSVNGSL